MTETIPAVDHGAEAIAAARSYCGWHVTPERTETLILDGPSGDLLVIPTLRMVELAEIVENGVVLDPDSYQWSVRGLVRRDCAWWTHRYGGIAVTLTHGFESASDWWSAVRSYTDRLQTVGVGGGAREAVGPFVFGATPMSAGSAFSDAEKAILDRYKLEPSV